MRLLDLSHNTLEKLDNKTHSLIEDCLSLEKVNLLRSFQTCLTILFDQVELHPRHQTESSRCQLVR